MSRAPSVAALQEISGRLRDAGIVHALGGSGLLFALGLAGEVNDWDITVEAPFEMIEPILKDLEWELIGQTENFVSDYLVRIYLGSSVIEIISGFTIEGKEGKHRVPLDVSGFWQNVPLANPEVWQKAYELMGRTEKVTKLMDYLAGANKK